MSTKDYSVARRRQLLQMLLHASQAEPAADWPRLVRVACQFGAGISPRVTAAEFKNLHTLKIADIFGRPA